MASDRQLLAYVLRLADSDLILAQRLGAWVGHGPVLEEDIALTNVGLDLLGQARPGTPMPARSRPASLLRAAPRTNSLSFARAAASAICCSPSSPNGNYADTTARQFYFDLWHELVLHELVGSTDARIAEIASKALKEVTYHAERSSDWVIRLGDGTELSHARMQTAIDDLWMYTGEMFAVDETEQSLIGGVAADAAALLPTWRERVARVLDEATLTVPGDAWMQRGGKEGVHTEHLGHLLAEMQSLHRAYSGGGVVTEMVVAALECSGQGGDSLGVPRSRAETANVPGADLPSMKSIWSALAAVPDPENPRDLGGRSRHRADVSWRDGELVVAVTPTYSGCPATEVIARDIGSALTRAGVERFRIETRLSPAWTTDWIAADARQRLAHYGIAPPGRCADSSELRRIDISGLRRRRGEAARIACPRCQSTRTHEQSRYGSTPCKAQYRCDDCLEPFDYFKPH